MEINEIAYNCKKGSVGQGDNTGLLTQAAMAQLLVVSVANYMALGKSLNHHRMCPGFRSDNSNIILLLQSMGLVLGCESQRKN